MKLQVIIPGAYNDFEGHAEYREAGDTFEASNGYGKNLIIEGYCQISSRPAPRTMAAPTDQYREELSSAISPMEMTKISDLGNLASLLEVNGISEEILINLINKGYTELSDIAEIPFTQLQDDLPGMAATVIKGMQKRAKRALKEQLGIE